jgi:hypothetical protein
VTQPNEDLPLIPPPRLGELAETSRAVAEAAALAGGYDLSNRQALNRFSKLMRDNRLDGAIHGVVVSGVVIVGVAGAIMFGTIVWHVTAPDSWRFLSEKEVGDLQKFLFSGLMGSALTFFAKRAGGSNGENPGEEGDG